jgi:3-deoxy-D-manno-octulosonate 8-phosphate phosphatase (KDO 8-P phosphatase)
MPDSEFRTPNSELRTLQDRCAAIEWLVLDVDGVLTDGGIVYGSGGLELKQFHVHDGTGIKLWHQAGKHSALITGRESPVVALRAAELGVDRVFQGVGDKLSAFRRLLAEAGVSSEAVCYVGDDLPDLPPLLHCGLAVAPADCCAEARSVAHYVTPHAGGRGTVRDTIELILRCQGAWQRLVDHLRGEIL